MLLLILCGVCVLVPGQTVSPFRPGFVAVNRHSRIGSLIAAFVLDQRAGPFVLPLNFEYKNLSS